MRAAPLAGTAAVLFALTAGLVAAGALHGLDHYAVSHLMPWLEPRRTAKVTLRSLTLPRIHGSLGRTLVELWTYPAAVVPSLVLVLACPSRLAWLGVWLVGNAVEVAGKLAITRPALYAGRVHVTAFDNSLPSGHTIRAFVVAGAVAASWRAGRSALAWAVGVPFALVALGDHTPTDVAAGAFVAAALLACARLRRPAARRGLR